MTTYICAYCQKEFNVTLTDTEVSHGICNRHFRLMMLEIGRTESQIEAMLAKRQGNKCEDLSLS